MTDATPTPPTPKTLNPYLATLCTLAVAALLIGLILVIAGQPDEYNGDLGSESQVALGAWFGSVGATLGAAWLVVCALGWKPGPQPPYRPNPHLDRIAPEPPR